MYTLLLAYLPQPLAKIALTIWYFALLLLITKYAANAGDPLPYGDL